MKKLPWCQIFDLDGTLAIRGERSPYDWDRVGEDTVNENVAHLLLMNELSADTYNEDTAIILSGRSDICRDETHKWLSEHIYSYSAVYMRKHGDNRCDTIIKREMYDEYIKDKYNVRFVVDDRPKVCRMWRELGLTVLQVGDPHIEF